MERTLNPKVQIPAPFSSLSK